MQPHSLTEIIAHLSPEDRTKLYQHLSIEGAAKIGSDWSDGGISRRSQRLPDGNWRYWLMLAGRGFGKTMTLSGVARQFIQQPGQEIGAMIGATSDDVRRVLVEGESGVLATSPPDLRPLHKKVDRMLQWPNGARTYLYSAEDPDRLRGGNNSYVLADELAAWKKPDDVWAQAMLTLRSGPNPRAVIATTPRPIPIIRKLASDPRTYLTTGSTYDNIQNLAEAFIEEIVQGYEGSRLGQQELEGKILTDTPAALWRNEDIRYAPDTDLRALSRVVIGVDPSGTAKGDTCGIIVVGQNPDKTIVALEDASIQGSPQQWADQVGRAFDRWQADMVVAETNFGGDLVVEVLQRNAPHLPVRKIHASRGKVLRAEPVALLFETERAFLLGPMPELEQQMTQMSSNPAIGFTGQGSPDRVDALVHATTYLSGTRSAPDASVVSAPKTSSVTVRVV